MIILRTLSNWHKHHYYLKSSPVRHVVITDYRILNNTELAGNDTTSKPILMKIGHLLQILQWGHKHVCSLHFSIS